MSVPHRSRKEEWALLYQHQQRQYDLQQDFERQKERLRKQAFKQALDEHVYERRSRSQDQRISDVNYYSALQTRAKMEEQMEEKARIEKLAYRKEVEGDNLRMINDHRTRTDQNPQNVYRIGMEDVESIKRRSEINKKVLYKQLQQQKYIKNVMREEDKIRQLEKDLADREYDIQKEQQRVEEIQRTHSYKQNMDVYNQYNRLNQDKDKKEQEFKRKLIDIPASRMDKKREEREVRENLQKAKKNASMKDSLLSQIQVHNNAKTQKDATATYNNKMYDEFYRDKRPKFDKEDYLRTLGQQRSQELTRKSAHKYMTEQDYKFNLNSLNKVIDNNQRLLTYDSKSSAMQIGSSQEVSRRKDDIYFTKIGSREIATPQMDRVNREQRVRRHVSQLEDSKDLNFIRAKIQQLMSKKELSQKTKGY